MRLSLAPGSVTPCALTLTLAIVIATATAASGCGLDTQGSHFGRGDTLTGAGGASVSATGSAAGGASGEGGAAMGSGGEGPTASGGGGHGGGVISVTDWWNPKFPTRAPIQVQANGTSVPAGYSVSLIFDHKSLVDAGQSLVDGIDVRVVCGDPGSFVELDRVIDPGSGWNRPDTRLWFRFPLPLVGNAADTSCSLYFGASATDAAGPPGDGTKVFLFFDDFESGNLNQWAVQNGNELAVGTEIFHRGSNALKGSPVGTGSSRWISAKGLNEADVAMEAYWYMTRIDGMDLAQGFRAANAPPKHQYETNLEGTSGWDIAKMISDGFDELVSQPSNQNPQSKTWTRITTAITGKSMKVFRDGSQLVPTSGFHDVGSEIGAGTVSLRLHRVPTGEAWWIDDVFVRRFIDPEPTATLMAPESLP